MSDPLVQIREVYSKPSTFDDGRACRVCCDKDNPAADQVEISITKRGHSQEMRFSRYSFTGHNDRGQYQREGEWPYEKGQLKGMLQAAFEQGVNHQRRETRALFEKVLGI